MKKKIYISLSIFLFMLFGALFIAIIESLAIKCIIADFDKYGLGLTWSALISIRNTFAGLVFIGFSVFGYFIGQKWWKYVYVEKKYKINMNKKILFSFLLFILFFGTACSRSNIKEDVLMDELASDNKYHYTNEGLGFSVDFPEQFIYFQTQRNDYKGFIDMEYFVPTSDREYPQQIQSYGKFLTVRIFDKSEYEENENFVYLGDKNKQIFVAIFWDSVPVDWKNKWSEEVKNEIISSFKMY
ncbi:MAG: hypothetical protein PF572_05325 [Patescibacteria group bacterium]|nr:hypothetical protein [Patescibacteria group bacterium]